VCLLSSAGAVGSCILNKPLSPKDKMRRGREKGPKTGKGKRKKVWRSNVKGHFSSSSP
jgi:hypothetical protein